MHLRLLLCGMLLGFTSLIHAAENLSADIALLKNALDTAHPGYNRYLSDAEQAGLWRELEEVAANQPSALAFYGAVSKLLVSLRCEHTKAEFSPQLDAQKRQAFMPFRFRFFDNRMFVQYAHHNTGLKKGDEILSINGYPIQQIISQLSPYVERDGYTDHTILSPMEQNFDLLGSSFEQFFSAVVLKQDSFATQFKVTYIANDENETITTQMPAIDFEQWLSLSNRPYRLNFKDAVHLDIHDETAVLAVNTFVNYRQPVDANAIFERIFSRLSKQGITKLIVDLRQNGGGSDDAQMALLRHLYTVPFTLVEGAWLSPNPLGELATQLTSWDRTAIDIDKSTFPLSPMGRAISTQALGVNAQKQTPAEHAFKGQIVLLTSKKNASASAALLSHIQQQPNVTLVGEPTGGNQGGTTASIIAFLTLPASKIVVRVPLIRNRYNIDSALDGLGAYPDIYAPDTLQTFLDDQDPAMTTALALLKSPQ